MDIALRLGFGHVFAALIILLILFIAYRCVKGIFHTQSTNHDLALRPILRTRVPIEGKLSSYPVELLQRKPYVTFDASNLRHQEAFWLLHKHGRLHPDLRFNYDGFVHDNAYEAMIEAMLEQAMSQPAKVDANASAHRMELLSQKRTAFREAQEASVEADAQVAKEAAEQNQTPIPDNAAVLAIRGLVELFANLRIKTPAPTPVEAPNES